MYYFVRVNGDTNHNNPGRQRWFVDGEPPKFPTTYFNYLRYCLQNDIVRIGWPDVGDLVAGGKKGALASAYILASLPEHVQGYLTAFKEIRPGEIVVTTDKDSNGDIYIGTVTKPYSYFHDRPKHPYECAHRVGVSWDRDARGAPVKYKATALSIPTRGGFWTRAFQVLDNSSFAPKILPAIRQARRHRSVAG